MVLPPEGVNGTKAMICPLEMPLKEDDVTVKFLRGFLQIFCQVFLKCYQFHLEV